MAIRSFLTAVRSYSFITLRVLQLISLLIVLGAFADGKKIALRNAIDKTDEFKLHTVWS